MNIIQTNAFCKTDPGLRRSNNEDVCKANNSDQFYLVADGVGGNAAGEVAAKIFLETVDETFLTAAGSTLDNVAIVVKQCFHIAHQKLRKFVSDHPDHKGMGCTAEVLAFCDGNAVIGHVGDSRSYLYRGGELLQITDDHSFVHEQVKAGLLTEEQARTHHMRNVILRAVGIEEDIEADIISCEVQVGDVFLLCTDGLTDMVEDQHISTILTMDNKLEVKGEQLIALANDSGGKDNIAVVLVEVLPS